MGVAGLTFNATTPELMAAANKADEAGGQIARMVNALLDGLAPMQVGLVGAAGYSFQQAQSDVHRDLVTITNALHEVAEGVRSAGRDFAAADADAQHEVTRAAADAGTIVARLSGSAG